MKKQLFFVICLSPLLTFAQSRVVVDNPIQRPAFVKFTDGTNFAYVTSTGAVRTEQGALSFLTDSIMSYDTGVSNKLVTLETNLNSISNLLNGLSKVVSVTPATDISAFAANDVACYPFELDCARANGKGVYLNSITGYSKQDCSTAPPSFELYLFDTYPTVAAPNVAWDMDDTSIGYCIGGPYTIGTGYWAAHSTLNGTFQTNTLSTLLFPTAGSTKIYGVLKAKAVYTPSATNDMVLKFKFMQD